MQEKRKKMDNKTNQTNKPEAPAATDAATPAKSPFERFRLSQDFAAGNVRRVQSAAAIRKPHKTEFFRTHVKDRITMAALKYGPGGREELYLVEPELAAERQELSVLVVPVEFQRAVNLDGEEFILPKPVPEELGGNRWHVSRFQLAQLAETSWVRIVANMSLGLYEGSEAISDLPEPAWSAFSFEDLLDKAFEGRIISAVDHAVLKALRGESA